MALKDIFSKLVKPPPRMNYASLLSNITPVFSQFGEDIYVSDVVQNCIDIIATECSKLMPRHIRVDSKGLHVEVKSNFNRLFKFSPNPLMTTKDFIEKVIWLLYMNYNAFIYPLFETRYNQDGTPVTEATAYYPLNPRQVEFLQDETGRLFIKFWFMQTDGFILPYTDVIHLRKKFSVSDIMGGGYNGQPDNAALLKVLTINDTVLSGLDKAVRTSLAIRGILKINTMLDDEKLAAERSKFEAALESGRSGILPADLKSEYIELKADPKLIDKDTIAFLQAKVLSWYGVSAPILMGDFTDEQYQAFYEKTLEPLLNSLGQAFSKCLFTQREIDVGNEIVFYPQKLLFTNTKNKISVSDILGGRGALTNNQLLDLFGYPPYEGGDVRVMSLNYIDASLANDYQMKKAGLGKKEEMEDGQKEE